MAMNYVGEARTTALVEAVKVTSHSPRFHGTMNNPEIIDFASAEILKLARDFERYILNG